MAERKTNVNLPIKKSHPFRFMGGVFLTGLVVVGGAILLGRSDTGQIDVSATIIDAQTTASEANNGDAGAVGEVAPSQPIHADMPNGGLVSTNAVPPPADIPPEPTPESASTTASSTPEAGSDANGEAEGEGAESDSTVETVEGAAGGAN